MGRVAGLLLALLGGCGPAPIHLAPDGLSYDLVVPVVIDAEGAPLRVEPTFAIDHGEVATAQRFRLDDDLGERLALVATSLEALERRFPSFDAERASAVSILRGAPPPAPTSVGATIEAPLDDTFEIMVLDPAASPALVPADTAAIDRLFAGLKLVIPVDPRVCAPTLALRPFTSERRELLGFVDEGGLTTVPVGVARANDDEVLFVARTRAFFFGRGSKIDDPKDYLILPFPALDRVQPEPGARRIAVRSRGDELRVAVVMAFSGQRAEDSAQTVVDEILRYPGLLAQQRAAHLSLGGGGEGLFDVAYGPDGGLVAVGDGGLTHVGTEPGEFREEPGRGPLYRATGGPPGRPHVVGGAGVVYLGDVRGALTALPLPFEGPEAPEIVALAASSDPDPEIWAMTDPTGMYRRPPGGAFARVRPLLPAELLACATAGDRPEPIEYKDAAIVGDALFLLTSCSALLRIDRRTGCVSAVPIAGEPIRPTEELVAFDVEPERITVAGPRAVLYEVGL